MQRGTFDSLYRENTVAPLACTPATCPPIPSLANPLIKQKHHVSPIAQIIDSGEFNLQFKHPEMFREVQCWPAGQSPQTGNWYQPISLKATMIGGFAVFAQVWPFQLPTPGVGKLASHLYPQSCLLHPWNNYSISTLWLRSFVFLMTSRVVTWHCLAWPNNMFDKLT